MKTIVLAAAAAAAALSAPAFAQETAPDGSNAFGFVPYVGVMGGYNSFDSNKSNGQFNRAGRGNGAVVQGVVGANLPLGPGFVGVEGNAAKDFDDLDWEYGVAGRVGFRAGDSGLVYVKGGYQWTNFDNSRQDHKGVLYGIGAEVGPKDIGLDGLTSNAGIRLRFDLDTVEFKSFKPMAGVVFHF
jgi:outer membrane immunogenic protein